MQQIKDLLTQLKSCQLITRFESSQRLSKTVVLKYKSIKIVCTSIKQLGSVGEPVCYFYRYPTVTRKWQLSGVFWMNLQSALILEFSGFSLFLPLNLLLVQSQQAEKIIIMHFIQGCSNMCNKGRS